MPRNRRDRHISYWYKLWKESVQTSPTAFCGWTSSDDASKDALRNGCYGKRAGLGGKAPFAAENRLVFKPSLMDRITSGRPLCTPNSEFANASVSQFLADSYRAAIRDRPHEYVFKNEITNQLFAERHSLETSGILSEFRVSTTRLDMVIANGTTKCYEIKTDRDELRRLPNQLHAASSAFDKIFVVTTPSYLAAVESLTMDRPHVGIFILDSSAKLIRIRRALSNAVNIEPAVVFDCLRRSEYVRPLERHFGPLPIVPNTRIYSTYKALFCTLSSVEAHKILLAALRARSRRKGDQVAHQIVPYELRHLYFSAPPNVRARYARAALYERRVIGVT